MLLSLVIFFSCDWQRRTARRRLSCRRAVRRESRDVSFFSCCFCFLSQQETRGFHPSCVHNSYCTFLSWEGNQKFSSRPARGAVLFFLKGGAGVQFSSWLEKKTTELHDHMMMICTTKTIPKHPQGFPDKSGVSPLLTASCSN